MVRLLKGARVANVPKAQTQPTRPTSEEVLSRIATTYGVRVGTLLARSHREGYQTAVYLLRRAANAPLQTVARRFGVSPSRVSKIQRALEAKPLTPQQRQVFVECKVKN